MVQPRLVGSRNQIIALSIDSLGPHSKVFQRPLKYLLRSAGFPSRPPALTRTSILWDRGQPYKANLQVAHKLTVKNLVEARRDGVSKSFPSVAQFTTPPPAIPIPPRKLTHSVPPRRSPRPAWRPPARYETDQSGAPWDGATYQHISLDHMYPAARGTKARHPANPGEGALAMWGTTERPSREATDRPKSRDQRSGPGALAGWLAGGGPGESAGRECGKCGKGFGVRWEGGGRTKGFVAIELS
ncbi:hypothetical protein BDY21DRAFT_162426 [Lineolata rhizophorae]|uniref:Uncharacterized protein n=1 Tax=Lineolata rhizophorae TaxID=578093 RepID=A0A6A6P8Y4_9PEZI|nr:hypothetical protein BDY21DRAFT_162426 [Lineolata rhizophorae]